MPLCDLIAYQLSSRKAPLCSMLGSRFKAFKVLTHSLVMLYVMCREAAAVKREELKRAEEALMEARRQELLSEEDGYWRQRMDQQQRVEKLKTELAEQEELKGHSEVCAHGPSDASPLCSACICCKYISMSQHCLFILATL